MKYLFENENALELWFYITKELGIKMYPSSQDDVIYISEKSMTDTLLDLNQRFEFDAEKKRFFRKP